MEATSFNEANCVLGKPQDMTNDECMALSVWKGVTGDNNLPVVISCWKVTLEELEEIQRTGRVWLYVVGETMPPVDLTGISPFKE